MLPASATRVARHSADSINASLRNQTQRNIESYLAAEPVDINRRLRELDEEWDIERALEANASALALIGLGLGAFINRKWLALPAVVAGFLFQHALQGWCPPVPVFRRLGYRTPREIERERHALKVIRGDYREASETMQRTPPERVMEAVEL